jgi:hypothetical protein
VLEQQAKVMQAAVMLAVAEAAEAALEAQAKTVILDLDPQVVTVVQEHQVQYQVVHNFMPLVAVVETKTEFITLSQEQMVLVE